MTGGAGGTKPNTGFLSRAAGGDKPNTGFLTGGAVGDKSKIEFKLNATTSGE